MSYKRDGDDHALLFMQKKLRLEEVLCPNIPDDEVAVLSDGKLTCVVCKTVPIFDNIKILQVHRNTSKHKRKYQEFMKIKEEKLSIIEKRLQLAKEKGEDASELLVTKDVLLNKHTPARNHTTTSKKWRPKTKVLLHQSESLCKNGKIFGHKTSTFVSSPSSSSSTSAISRTQCLDKVTSTVQSPALEKLRDFSQLNETEKWQIRKNETYFKSCGWIRSKDGKWMKDPNVEFDSDDEAETVITSELSVTLAKR